MASFRDWLNRIVPAKALSERIADPRIDRSRHWMTNHPADGLTPQRLSSIHLQAAQGDPLRYFELAEDIEERDLHYAGVMATRKRSVSQLPITVMAASDSAEHKKHAALIQSWIDDEVLRAALFDMLDAVGKGLSIMEVDWQVRFGHMLPRELIWRTPTWFMFDQADGETVLLREGVAGMPLPSHKFVVHRHKSKSGLTVRSGIARVASWAWMFKSFSTKDWAMFVQNFGQPIRIGRFDRGATEAEKDVLWRAVVGIAGDCAAIVPNTMPIELIDVKSKGTSTDMYEKRADWLDRQISKLVLGQTTSTDAISGGHAVSREHRLVQEDIERSDAMIATATVNTQLIPNIIAFNFGPQERYPKIRIGRPDEVPLGEFSEAFAKLAPLGLTAESSYMRDRLGIPAPKKGAEVVGGRVAAQTPTPAGEEKSAADPKGVSANAVFGRLFASAHATQSPDLVDSLTARLEEDAAGAMNGLIEEVRLVLNSATDLRDAAERLAKLDLAPDDLAEAMARGMALAHLAGQASLIDDIKGRS